MSTSRSPSASVVGEPGTAPDKGPAARRSTDFTRAVNSFTENGFAT